MSARPIPLRREIGAPRRDPDLLGVAGVAPFAVFVLDEHNLLVEANDAAQSLFQASISVMTGRALSDFLSDGSPVAALIADCRRHGASVSDYDLPLGGARLDVTLSAAKAAPLPDRPGWIAVYLFERMLAESMGQRMAHRNAARSAAGMAMMLAHEVKNPLSGIRGAAQLLEKNAGADDRALATLIRDEADRIAKLLGQMDMFAEAPSLRQRAPLNIHAVMERVRQVAQNGFAAHVRMVEDYDPSLPPVLGDHDRLIQAVLNLVKNAAESCPPSGGEITLSTAFLSGVRIRAPGSAQPTRLPLVIGVRDNGAGVPDALRETLFDAFVSGKRAGKGLGLALVAKIVDEHGGVIDFESRRRHTQFRIRLPIWEDGV